MRATPALPARPAQSPWEQLTSRTAACGCQQVGWVRVGGGSRDEAGMQCCSAPASYCPGKGSNEEFSSLCIKS